MWFDSCYSDCQSIKGAILEPGQDFAKACADAQLGFVDNLPEKCPALLHGILRASVRCLKSSCKGS